MADEITLNLKLAVDKSFLVQKFDSSTQLVTMTGSTATGGVQTIGTTAEVLVMSDVTTSGYAYFRNTDAAIAIELGTGTTAFATFLKLKAGEVAVCRLSTNAPTARAASTTANLQYFILQD